MATATLLPLAGGPTLLRRPPTALPPATVPAARGRLRRLVVEPERQRDPLARHVHVEDLHLDDVARLHHVARVLDEGLGHRRHVYEAVLVDADVHERAERGDVRDDALQDHPRRQVGDLLDAVLEGRRLEGRTRVTARLLQFLEDVRDGRQTEHVVHEVGGLQGAQRGRVADQRADIAARRTGHPPHHRIRLGVHAGGVQRVVAAADAQEARALFVRLRAEPGHVLEALAVLERAVRVAVRHDVLGEAGADAGHPGEQRGRRRVHVHADAVHTVLDDRVEGAGELHFRQVVLVLTHADGLRVDLHQLGERILQAPGDRHRAAQRHIELRQLLRGERRRRIHRGAGLGHHHLGELQLRVLGDEFTGELVGLAGRGAVADGDQVDVVLLGEPREGGQGLVPLVRRDVRVDGVRRHDLAGGVHDGDLHARTETGVEAQRRARARRGGEQQVAQVRREHPHRLVLRGSAQPQPQVDAEVHQDPGPPGPADRVGQPLVARPPAVGDTEALGDRALVRGRDGRGGGVSGRLLRLQDQVEHVLLLAAQHGEDAVRGQLRERLGEVEVVGELGARLLLALAHLRGEAPAHPHALAQLADQVGVLGEPLGENGAGAVQGRLRVGDALVGVDERGGGRERLHRRVPEEPLGQRFETGLARDLRLGPPLRLERQVDVLQAGLRVGLADAGLQLVGELALLAYGVEDGAPPLFELAQIAQPLFERAQLRVVERLRRLLAVARDEGHRRPAVEQVHGGLHLPLPYAEFFGDPAFDGRWGDRHVAVPPSH
ncbi:hypothetical protein STRAU_1161 [Streptomyces aurantiacus JA 4570]|uniref:Uncharacterized protein n=1 Tax=Streptomyces aurantiacus JA 4570 TaxID=1286094 RepID=S4A4X7_9ACTN|nr:hypothetical protein STRAU_1161 [Streptomyces aurantiacus JA 4570]